LIKSDVNLAGLPNGVPLAPPCGRIVVPPLI
jgi:hypothetical protein